VDIMNSGAGRNALITVGIVALVVGAIWVGQGLNVIPGSFMTGDLKWFVIGLIVAVVGIVLVVVGLRRPKGRRGSSS
jgi:uncharacterized membrane protein YdbT with pleckstrin-like domain